MNARHQEIEEIAKLLLKDGQQLATAESCTGGMISTALTDFAGSSAWFDRGYVTYSNQAKHEMLGVSESLIDEHGAVSEPVALAMAGGASQFDRAASRCAIAVTGIAGPGGGSAEKPVGTVWIAWALPSGVVARKYQFDGDRQSIREQTTLAALSAFRKLLSADRK